MPASPVSLSAPLGTASDCPPQLGELVTFNVSRAVPGSDAPALSFPVYPLPSGMLMPVSRSSQTILASGVSSQQGRWSSAIPQTRDVSREGLFDAYCAPMDTGHCPLVSTGHIGSLRTPDRRLLILTRRSVFRCITNGFCCSVLRPFGFRTWIRRMMWRPPFICNVTPV